MKNIKIFFDKIYFYTKLAYLFSKLLIKMLTTFAKYIFCKIQTLYYKIVHTFWFVCNILFDFIFLSKYGVFFAWVFLFIILTLIFNN